MIELVGNSILALIAAVVLISMWRFHKDEHYKRFNLVDMITARDGRISRPALMEFGAWLVATWGFIILINQGKLTEWYMGVYIGAFVIRAGHAAYMNAHDVENGKPAPALPEKK